MPTGDRTGPEGQGAKTGRGAGFCSGSDTPGYNNPGGRGLFRRMGDFFRGGRGRGAGGGRGAGRRGGGRGRDFFSGYAFDPQPINEREWIEREEKFLKNRLEDIQQRKNQLSADE